MMSDFVRTNKKYESENKSFTSYWREERLINNNNISSPVNLDEKTHSQIITYMKKEKNEYTIDEDRILQAKKSKGELLCVVCGATANGYNFDAITCESCKAFFRRNAFRSLVIFFYFFFNFCSIFYHIYQQRVYFDAPITIPVKLQLLLAKSAKNVGL
jgi:hypothetical protein